MALLNVIVNELPRVVRQPSPLRTLLAVSTADAAGGATAGDVEVLAAGNVAAFLGDATTGRRWYEALEAYANFHLASLLYDPTSNATKAAALTGFTGDPEAVSAAGGSLDAILWPDDEMNSTLAAAIAASGALLNAIPIIDSDYGVTATAAAAQAFATNVVPIGTLAVSNGADFNGQAENGSVIAAAHIARYVGINGIGVHPFSFGHPLFGAADPDPKRVFSDSDGSAAAVDLSRRSLSSIIVDGGVAYLWGGRVKSATATSALRFFGNRMVANRMVKRGRQVIRPRLVRRLTPSLLDTVVSELEATLLVEYGRFVESVSGGVATVSGDNHLNVRTGVKFHGFAETVELTIDAI